MKNLSAYLYLTAAMFLAGSSVVVGKLIIGVFPVFLSQAITLFIALVTILPLAWWVEGNPFKLKLHKRDLVFLALQALFGMFLFRVFLLYGLKLTTAIEGGIITSTGPAVLTLLSLVILKERIKFSAWLGIVVCVVGVLVINMVSARMTTPTGSLRFLGNFMVLLAVVGEALFTIFRKKLSYTGKPITSTAIIIAFAFVMFLPISVFQSISFNFAAVALADFIPIIIYGVFCTVLAYICWFAGVARVKVSVAAGFTGVMPVASVLLSFLVLGERIGWQHVVGMMLVILGIFIIAKAGNGKHKRA